MILDDVMTVNLKLSLRPLPIYFIQEIKNEVDDISKYESITIPACGLCLNRDRILLLASTKKVNIDFEPKKRFS